MSSSLFENAAPSPPVVLWGRCGFCNKRTHRPGIRTEEKDGWRWSFECSTCGNIVAVQPVPEFSVGIYPPTIEYDGPVPRVEFCCECGWFHSEWRLCGEVDEVRARLRWEVMTPAQREQRLRWVAAREIELDQDPED